MDHIIASTAAIADALKAATAAIAAHCDGALADDDIGFNKADSSFGRYIATVPGNDWTAEQCAVVREMLKKYKGQLADAGIDWAALPEVQIAADLPADARKAALRQFKAQQEQLDVAAEVTAWSAGRPLHECHLIRQRPLAWVEGGAVVLLSPYDAALVAAIKALPSRKFDGARKVWIADRASASSLDALLTQWGFIRHASVAPWLAAAQAPAAAPVAKPQIVLDGDCIVLDAPYSADVTAAVRHVRGRRWDAARKVNTFPLSAAKDVALLAARFGWTGREVLERAAEAQQAHAQTMVAASAAAEAQADALPLAGFGDATHRLRPFQAAGVRYALEAKGRVIIGDSMGLGKQQPIDAPILTPSGWRLIGDLRTGDQVIGSDGQPTIVTGIFPQGIKPSYRVRFSDHSSVEAGPEHLWTVRHKCGGRRLRDITLTTDDLRLRPTIQQAWINGRKTNMDLSRTTLYLPMLERPVNFSTANTLPLPPYLIGQLLANGSTAHGTPALSANAQDWPEVRDRIRAEGVPIPEGNRYGNTNRATIPNILTQVRNLGIDIHSPIKFIPQSYKVATPAARIALLHGLMDADGSISKTNNKLTYHTTSERLARDIQELIECLGGIASVRTYDRAAEGKPIEYQVRLRLPVNVLPFSISRKASRYHPGRLARPTRTVVAVEYVRDVESVCIAVAAQDALYCTEHCILTHNTIQALATLHAQDAFPALVICPKAVKGNWRREARAWLPSRHVALLNGGKADANWEAADLVVINYDVLAKWQGALVERNFRAIVLDESHMAKNKSAARTQAALLLAQGIRMDVWKAADKDAQQALRKAARGIPLRLALTGTAVTNRPIELVAQLDFLGRLQEFGGFWAFVKQYCGATQTKYGWDMTGATHLPELATRLRSCCYVRRETRDVAPELPPVERVHQPVEIKDLAAYRAALADVIGWMRGRREAAEQGIDGYSSAQYQAEALVRIEALKQLVALAKLDSVVAWVEYWLEAAPEASKLVLFASHREIQDALRERLAAHKPAWIRAEDSVDARDAQIARFGADPACRVMVASLAAGGTGLNLQCADAVAFSEFGWHAAIHDQAEGRISRIGQQASRLTSYWLAADGTFDDDILDLIESKRAIVDAINAGVDAAQAGATKSLVDWFEGAVGMRAESQEKA